MSISPSKPQLGHLSSCDPETLGISICEEHSGHSTVIVSIIPLLTTRFLITFFFAGFFNFSSPELESKVELLDRELGGKGVVGGD